MEIFEIKFNKPSVSNGIRLVKLRSGDNPGIENDPGTKAEPV